MKDCTQCGKCCIKYGNGSLFASQEEIDQWELFDPDIFAYVANNEIWVDPKTGIKLERCPFLEIEHSELVRSGSVGSPIKYTCGIYESRPEDCRQYPSLLSEMIADECEMIEVGDLENLRLAQKKLSRIIKDSR